MIREFREGLQKVWEGIGVSSPLFTSGIQISAVIGLFGCYMLYQGHSAKYLVLAAVPLGFMTAGSVISGTLEKELSDTNFRRDTPVLGILPNLFLSAVRGEWDWWDSVLLVILCLALLAFYRPLLML